uniref:Pentacotripeptide-repeat region of PRORP domain-containing protein n=1 Tax=Gossypium raimondii TaxID=29730 RepID=A0A0D2R1S7_GOSRA|nr:hypothetical protein B456_010G041000 [Gossypium raimondii]
MRAHHQTGVWLPVIGIPHAERRLGIPYRFLFSIPYSTLIDFCFFHRYCTGLAAAILMQNLSRISMAATAYSNGVKPDVVTYTILMKALIRVDKFHKVPAVYEEMILSGCTPDRKARAMLRSALRYIKQAVKS